VECSQLRFVNLRTLDFGQLKQPVELAKFLGRWYRKKEKGGLKWRNLEVRWNVNLRTLDNSDYQLNFSPRFLIASKVPEIA
jgi:hypothetical protein